METIRNRKYILLWRRIAESGFFLSALDKTHHCAKLIICLETYDSGSPLQSSRNMGLSEGFRTYFLRLRPTDGADWHCRIRHSYWKHDLYTKSYLCLYIHIIYKQIMAQRSQVTCANWTASKHNWEMKPDLSDFNVCVLEKTAGPVL